MVTILDKSYIVIKLEDKILQNYANRQVFYIANMLGKIERLLKSVFVTKGRWYSLKSNSEIKLLDLSNKS